MQASKNIIKIELNQYQILPSTTITSAISFIPDPIIKTEINKEKEEKFDHKPNNRIQYIPADQQFHQINQAQTKNQQDSEDIDSTYKQILSAVTWQCPCGKKVYGPIQFFLHIKKKHQYDTLEKIIQQKTLKKMFQFYPKVHKNQIQIIQELDSVSFQESLAEIANKYVAYLKGKDMGLQQPKERGSFSDMTVKFIQNIKDNNAKILMKFFFTFLKEFIDAHFGNDVWYQQSPKDLLKYSNNIFNYFSDKQVKIRYRPLSEEDTKRIIYILSKWMFINRWTNDRIFNTLPASPQNEQSSCDEVDIQKFQQKKQNEDQLH